MSDEQLTAQDVVEPTRADLDYAVDDIRDSVAAFTYDGDRASQDHLSGAPEERELVLGDDDPEMRHVSSSATSFHAENTRLLT